MHRNVLLYCIIINLLLDMHHTFVAQLR